MEDEFTYDEMNRIARAIRFNEIYNFDIRGNKQVLESENFTDISNVQQYEYDEWDRLTKVKTADQGVVEYRYKGTSRNFQII
ncbi:hypothetical protein ACFSTH_09460 [Paenibacillus yanchengensis]|uniref:RHS repeat protein n=1 Tax=Paenibacillus yanchengensis TaxID=2035833 RepID=A0ABW4YPM0_9BACL